MKHLLFATMTMIAAAPTAAMAQTNPYDFALGYTQLQQQNSWNAANTINRALGGVVQPVPPPVQYNFGGGASSSPYAMPNPAPGVIPCYSLFGCR